VPPPDPPVFLRVTDPCVPRQERVAALPGCPPPEDQVLLFAGTPLDDDAVLGCGPLPEFATLDVSTRLLGGTSSLAGCSLA